MRMAGYEGKKEGDIFGDGDNSERLDNPISESPAEEVAKQRKTSAVETEAESVEAPVDAETYFESWKGDFERFYDTVRRYYRDEEWTILKIHEHSPEIRSFIDTMRTVLEQGGVTVHGEQDRLFNRLMAEARGAKDTRDFWASISQRKAMAPKTPLAELYDGVVKGARAAQERTGKVA